MKLLIAADIFPPDAGGPATYAVTLANELTKRGDKVSIVSLNPRSERGSLLPAVKLYRVHTRRKLWRYIEYLALLWCLAFTHDLVYAMGPVNAGWPAFKATRWRLRPKKFAVKVVGDYAWEQGVLREGLTATVDEWQKLSPAGLSGRLRAAQRTVVQNADLVIVPCRYLCGLVVGWGARLEKVRVIYNAVEFKAVDPVPNKPAGERWIVSAGRLVPWKGFGALVALMPQILSVVPPARLKIIGDGPEYHNLRFQVEKLKLDFAVELVGKLPREKTLAYIQAADLLVLNSGYEGLSHVALEALAFGRPVLASAAGGNRELGLPAENIFPYDDAAAIAQKVVHCFKIGCLDRGPAFAPDRAAFFSQFGVPTMIDHTKAALESLCAS